MKVSDLVKLLLEKNQDQEIGRRIRDSGSNSYFDPILEIQEVLELNRSEYSECDCIGYMPITDRTDLIVNKVLILE